MSNIDWLLREGVKTEPLKLAARNVAGLRVHLTEATAHRGITVESRDDRSDAWMGGQTTIAGRAMIDLLDGARSDATARKAVLFRPAQRAAA